MSALFLTNFSDHLQNNQREEAIKFAIEQFQRTSEPWEEFFKYLQTLCRRKSENFLIIHTLIEAFKQWKNRLGSRVINPQFEKNLFLSSLPTGVLQDFCDLFPVSKEYLVNIIRNALHDGPIEKHLLNIIVHLDLQSQFSPPEVLLPLILANKDPLIHTFLNKKAELEDYLLSLLDHLYENGGQRLGWILEREFGIYDRNSINKKTLRKLTIRFWNSIGRERVERYPNLATLQDRGTIGYLIGIKYSGASGEKSMSDECWNESIEDVINGNRELAQFFLELLVQNNDGPALNYCRTISFTRTICSTISQIFSS